MPRRTTARVPRSSERCAGLRVAVAWTLTGAHDGAAGLGPLTGAPLALLGASQVLAHDGRVVRGHDETALRSQVDAAPGAWGGSRGTGGTVGRWLTP